jgi:hypothetical protein
LPGTLFYLDPDLPEIGWRLALKASGPAGLIWQSRSVNCLAQSNQCYALLSEGRHELKVVNPATGEEDKTWIQVKTLGSEQTSDLTAGTLSKR